MKKAVGTTLSIGTTVRMFFMAVLVITVIHEAGARQAVPSISSFSPSFGPIGTSVTISGSNFDPTPANNIVYFGGVKGTVTGVTSTSLTVTVPAGPSCTRIGVTVNGLMALSQKYYTVTFTSNRIIDGGSFSPRVDLPASSVTYNVATGDLDGDGKPDLVAASYGTDRVFVFRNISTSGSLSAGSFAPEADFSTGDLSTGLILVDLDGDGKLDIVASHHNIGGPDDHHIAVMRNTSIPGTISFEPAILFEAGTGPFSVAADDFDHDGKPDLVVANFRSNNVSFFRNSSTPGTVSLDAKQDFMVANYPRELTAADVDGDGKSDVVVACGGEVDVLHNTTATSVSFDAPFRLTGTGSLIPVVVGDFDGDGKPDLATANNANQVLIFPNSSLPGALSFGTPKTLTSGDSPWDIAIGDLDGDAKPDLVVANRSTTSNPGSVSVFRNTGVPGAISFAAKVDFAARVGPGGLAIGDLDGDGKPDIAISHEWDNYVSILRNTISPIPPPNNSALFDGLLNGSRIRVADGSSINPAANQNAYKINGNSLTVEAWVYPLGYPDPQFGNPIIVRPLNMTSSDPYHSYALWVYHGNGFAQPAFSISDGTPGSQRVVLSSDALPTFHWTHLAGVYDGATLKIYVNGILKGEYNANVTINSSTGIGLYVGRFLGDRFQGAIDEVRLWNISRTQGEISSAKDVELTGNEQGLAGYWKMNSSIVLPNKSVIVQDQTGNQNDLQVQGLTPMIAFNPMTMYDVPTLTYTPVSLDLGTVDRGVSSTGNVEFTNTGNSPVLGTFEVASSNLQVAGSSVFIVPPGQTANKSFGALSTVAGPRSGMLTVHTNAAAPFQIPFTILVISPHQFDANKLSMWTLRDGRFATDPTAGYLSAGLEWPKASGKYVVYASGIWIGAKVNGDVRTATASYSSEFQPGPILGVGGVGANPNDTTYRVYKASIGDNASTNSDYAQWPVALGAPVNPDGTPRIIGDQTLFAVYNDLNAAKHSFSTQPLGAEVQQTTFGFNQTGARENTVFIRFKIINKSMQTWQNTYVSLWSDPDLGNAGDDLIGIDVPQNLGYVYNGSNTDAVYGTPPPAAGYNVLEGAFYTKPIQGFSYYTNGVAVPYTDPTNGTQAYNFMQGLWSNATPYIDPTTSVPTTFAFSGDPVTGTGWIDHNPGDRRFLFSTGPFNLEPGQSKELIAAIIVGQGATNLNSITALRSASDEIQSLYTNGQIFGGALVDVASASAPSGGSNTLNDLAQSGAQLTFTGGAGGATVEVGTYADAPPDALPITTPTIAGVGRYLDVQVQGSVQWPADVRVYYTRNDLLKAGIVESDLQGLYYWSGLANSWKLYSNSGSDDQGRGHSTTGVDTENVRINGIDYEGYVGAAVYHLMPTTIGASIKTITQRYDEAVKYVQSLPDAAFKKPASQRRSDLADKLGTSKSMFLSGNIKAAVQKLQQDILNHLTSQGNYTPDLWVVDDASRATLLRMVNDLVDVLQRPQSLAKMGAAGGLAVATAEDIPTEYGLSQNYPNPFNPSTSIQYQIPQAGQVTLKVYNTLGEEVATLVSGFQNPGIYRVQWSPQLPSGVYLYRLQSGNYVQSKKLLLLK